MSIFGRRDGGAGARPDQERTPRHSSGWAQMLQHMRASEGLRVLDIGPTSSNNINYITGLGHSIYMANVVGEAANPMWQIAGEQGAEFDVDGFLRENLNFSGRVFDVVLLWDTLDFLPEALAVPVMARIHEVMTPGGQMLAFFHAKKDGPEAVFARYHLTDGDNVSLQKIGGQQLLHAYSTRQAEHLLKNFASHRFFLAKDALREVMVTR